MASDGDCPEGEVCIPPSPPTDFDDYIVLGGGNDAVHSLGGNDTVYGGANRDRLYADSGDDALYGEGSNDKLYGGTGDDRLDGGGQNDRLYGGDGNDVIIGGDDDDVLYGDNPADANDAEGGIDIFVFDDDDGHDKVFDFETGLDTVQLTSGGTYTLIYDGNDSLLTYGNTVVTFYDETLSATDIVLV